MIALLVAALSFRQIQPDLIETDPSTGIPIRYERDGIMEAKVWGRDDEFPIVKILYPQEIARMRVIVRRAIAKYPKGFLKKRIDLIYICASLSVDDFSYGATYDRRGLYIVDGGVYAGFDDRFLEQCFHHEFSSVLMYEPKSNFPTRKWDALRPAGFRYQGYDKVYGDKEGLVKWDEQQPQWLSNGFVKKYSMVSVEEDLNTVAESIFDGGALFWRQVDRYPRLKTKIQMAIGFYHQLDPWFSEKRFRAWAK